MLKKTLFLFLLFVSILGVSQEDNDSIDFLKSTLNLENDDDYESFSMLDSVIEDYNVFFIGENHLFRKSNYQLQLKMLKYLHKNVGVSHMCLEFAYSRGWLINNYIQTGDTAVYEVLKKYSYDEYLSMYTALMEYNSTLDSTDKITVTGIDIERSYSISFKVLSMLLPDSAVIPEEIALSVEAIKSLAAYNDKRYNLDRGLSREEDVKADPWNGHNMAYFSTSNTYDDIYKNYQENKAVYEDFIGVECEQFDKIITGINDGELREEYQEKKMVQSYIFREQKLYEHFLEVVNENPGEKFFAQFGRCHTPVTEQKEWCEFYNFQSLVSRINNSQNKHINGKICSIATFYPESDIYYISTKEYENIEALIDSSGENNLTMFAVTSDTTYFEGLSDKFQFVIINTNDPKKDKETTDDLTEEWEWTYQPIYTHFEYSYGYIQMDFASLNADLFPNQDGFDDNLVTQTGGLTIYENNYFSGGFSFNSYGSQNIPLGDTLFVQLTGYSFNIHFGGDLIASEKVHLAPYLGYGYGQLNLIVDSDKSQGMGSSFFSTPERLTYKNNAFLLDLSLDARVNLWFIGLGVRGGYQFDLSNKHWRLDGVLREDTVKTSLGGFWAQATISIFFHD